MKQGQAIATLGISIFLLASGVTYGIGFAMKLPLPLVNDGVYKPDYAQQNAIMQSWQGVKTYHKGDTATEIETAEREKSELEFLSLFSEIDSTTIKNYIASNNDIIANGYGKLMLDKVDIGNTSTGIKTTLGDDVLGISAADNVIVVGLDVNGQKAKLGILKNKKQLGMSVVDNITYWEQIGTHANKENAILAINASDYTWNRTGDYGTIYGITMRNGDLIRRVQNADNIVGFNKDNDIQLGGSLTDLYNASEANQILVKDGTKQPFSDSNMSAKTAIGQTDDGVVLMLTVDGDDSTVGATYDDLANIMIKYGAANVAALSSGKCTTMWWNGRVVNKPNYTETDGIKLPTTWVIKHSTGAN